MSNKTTPSQNENKTKIDRKKILDDVKEELKKIRNYTPKVGVFGDTGVGKSSLCNAIFGRDIAPISDVEACTRKPQDVFVSNDNGGGINLVDVPGVGEDLEHHKEYISLYESLAPELDLILWVIKADDRKYMSAIDVYTKILEPNINTTPVLFVINQIDKIEPIAEWYGSGKNSLGETQKRNLDKKINDVAGRFNIDENSIAYVSTIKGNKYLKDLVGKIVDVLPDEKKYSFTREAEEENVTKDTAIKAEKGMWDYIKKKAGAAWDYVKDDVVELAVDSVKKYGPVLAKAVFSFLKSKI